MRPTSLAPVQRSFGPERAEASQNSPSVGGLPAWLKLNWLIGAVLAVAFAVSFWLLLRSMGRSAGSEEPLDA